MFVKENFKEKRQKGFTLIELLVVIAIIGFLAVIVMVALNSARTKARDTKRRGDLKQVAKALEMYYDAQPTGGYPSTAAGWWGNCSGYGSHGVSGANGWVPNLAPTYISALPLDPKPIGSDYCYLYKSNGTDYKLLAHQTTESVCPVPASDPMYDAARAGQCTFTVFSPGGSSW